MEANQQTKCKNCKDQLSNNLINLREAPDASLWVKEGFCSMSCYKKYLSENKRMYSPKTESKSNSIYSAHNKAKTIPKNDDEDKEKIIELHSLEDDGSIDNISWNNCVVKEGKALYKCIKCDKEYRIKESIFIKRRSIKKNDDTTKMTMNNITSPAPVSYNVPAFIIAAIMGSLLLILVGTGGKTPLWITLFSISIFGVLAKVIKTKRSHIEKIPVWFFLCPECNKKIYVASSGYSAFYGDIIKENKT